MSEQADTVVFIKIRSRIHLLFTFLKSKPPIDTDAKQWLFLQFNRLFDHLGTAHFNNEAVLVLPTPAFFPANENNAEQMAITTLEQVKIYCGMHQWPINISLAADRKPLPQLTFNNQFHGTDTIVTNDFSDNNRIDIKLDLKKFPKADTLVATLVQQLSAVLLAYTKIKPSQQDYIAVTELLGTFLGFGVMLANTSYQFRGGCGSCYQSGANRQTGLSEEEMIYSLAIFCQLKGIKNSIVLPHLKGYLKSVYKQSVKDMIKNGDDFSRLQARL